MTADREQTVQAAERRYEIHVLLGPCTEEEAESFVDRTVDHSLGAVWTLGPYDDRDYKAELEQADREQTRRDAEQVKHRVLWNWLVQPPETANHASDCPRCIIDALLAELEQAERRIAELETALDNCRDSLNG